MNPQTLHTTQNWFRQLDEFFQSPTRPQSVRAPRERLHRTEDGWVLEIELPGIRKSELGIEVKAARLHVTTQPETSRPFAQAETLDWKLGPKVDPEAIQAEFRDGLLRVTLPLRQERQPDSRKIEIN